MNTTAPADSPRLPWRLDDYDFALPAALIADRPAVPRDSSRLLVVGENILDDTVANLPDRLSPGDLLVFNRTRVIPARLIGRRGQVRVEITLHRQAGPARWRAFARPARKARRGDTLVFGADFSAAVAEKGEAGEIVLDFDQAGDALFAALDRHGVMPLPPYIKRPADDRDRQDYQTIFAREQGAVAAPTAGLHFTDRLLEALAGRGVERATVTLHVGAGTFLPVRVDDIRQHKMHAEWGEIDSSATEAINAARARGARVIAVGTTCLRLLESAASDDGVVSAFSGETDIFIYPGYRFRAVDALFTNFHLPRSTLFMLVAAFAGLDRIKRAYAHAIESEYRFYSYGDACLLFPEGR